MAHAKVTLHAQPYDTSASGWYFSTAAEFTKKFRSHLPVEEYEIEFIDGPDAAAELANAMGVNQANIEEYFERLDDVAGLDEAERAALHYALDVLREPFDKALRMVEDGDIRAVEGDAETWAEDYIDSMGGVGALGKNTIETYFDYEAFGRDLGYDLDSDNEDDRELLDMSDRERGEAYLDSVGVEVLFAKPRDRREAPLGERYFDLEAFARDLELGGDVTEFEYAGTTYTTDYR